MSEFIVVSTQDSKWKNTIWKGQVIPIEVERSHTLDYRTILVNNKVLGVLSKENEKLPFGCTVFVKLWTFEECTKMKIVDKPIDWLFLFIDPYEGGFNEDEFDLNFTNNVLRYDPYELGPSETFPELNMGKVLVAVSTPKEFYEWLIRAGFDDASMHNGSCLNDGYKQVTREYLEFIRWLEKKGVFIHLGNYGDEDIEEFNKTYYVDRKKQVAAEHKKDLECEAALLEYEFGRGI